LRSASAGKGKEGWGAKEKNGSNGFIILSREGHSTQECQTFVARKRERGHTNNWEGGYGGKTILYFEEKGKRAHWEKKKSSPPRRAKDSNAKKGRKKPSLFTPEFPQKKKGPSK